MENRTKTYYHYTLKDNIYGIIKDGLKPGKFRAYNVEFGIRQSLYHCSGPILQSFCLQKFRRTIWRSSVGNRNNFYS